ncbi:MAG: 3-deoxy-7-phosphoheptulonate synthase [Clostridiales bacterium]|nr:3-deoxy-7-phosphoheptulonate synthase [Clostridiales bacterium]
MSFVKKRAIPPLSEILADTPLSAEMKEIKRRRDAEIEAVIKGESGKFLIIVGPCSADNEDAVCDYVSRLAKAQERVSEKLIVIPRIYTCKPRTTGTGYKGMLHQPKPEEEPNILAGIYSIRRTHLRVMAESRLTAADEMLYPDNHVYVDDVLSYVAVGARSVEDKQHLMAASGVSVPVGLKNPTSGDLSVMFASIRQAQSPQAFIYHRNEAATTGNPAAHAIMRGFVDKSGASVPNYHYEDILTAREMYEKSGLAHPAVIIDTNHANSGKNFAEQPRIALDVMQSRRLNSGIRRLVKGLLIESYIKGGAQDITGGVYGQSITDGCLGWGQTETLIYEIAERV